jgi:hypothetical protein
MSYVVSSPADHDEQCIDPGGLKNESLAPEESGPMPRSARMGLAQVTVSGVPFPPDHLGNSLAHLADLVTA